MPRRCQLLLTTALAAGCVSPWAVMPGGLPGFELALLPPGTRCIEVPTANGERLRGLFVPGAPGAPVVLHLLEAMGSATHGCAPEVTGASGFGYPVLWELQDLGFASVMLDYRGVGASEGTRHVDHLLPDVQAMWLAAVHHAGGDPERVVLRTTSLGSIGAAALILDGIRPAAWTLIAPVDGRTVTDNVLAANLWTPFAWLVGALATTVADVPLGNALVTAPCPLLCFLPRSPDDGFLSAAEHRAIDATVRARGGRCHLLHHDHITCAASGHWLRPEERRLLRERFGTPAPLHHRVATALAVGEPADREDPRVLSRLQLLASYTNAAPELLLAAARSTVPPSALLPWVAWLDRRAAALGTRRPLADWAAVLDLGDGPDHDPLRADLIAKVAPFLLDRDLQLGPLDTLSLLGALQDREIERAHTIFYARPSTDEPGIAACVASSVVGAGRGSLDGTTADWFRRAGATLQRARGFTEPLLPPPGRPADVEGSLNAFMAGVADFAAAPAVLPGLDPELLFAAFAAGVADDPLLQVVLWQHRDDLRTLVTVHPELVDAPSLVVCCLLDRDLPLPAFPAQWLAKHASRLQAMPLGAVRRLAWNWQRSIQPDEVATEAVLVTIAEIDALVFPERVARKPVERQLGDLARRGLPARPTADGRGLEVFSGGGWRPFAMPQ